MLKVQSLNNEEINVVKYFSKTCAPCAALSNDLKKLSSANLIAVDAEEEDVDVLMEYGIRKLPTTLIFKGQEFITKVVGPNYEQIQDEVNKLK